MKHVTYEAVTVTNTKVNYRRKGKLSVARTAALNTWASQSWIKAST